MFDGAAARQTQAEAVAAIRKEMGFHRDAPRAQRLAQQQAVRTGTEVSSSAWSRKQGGASAGTCRCGECARSSSAPAPSPIRLRRDPAWAKGALIEITG